MGLKQCRNCRQLTPGDAEVCIHCGEHMAAHSFILEVFKYAAIASAFVLGFLLVRNVF